MNPLTDIKEKAREEVGDAISVGSSTDYNDDALNKALNDLIDRTALAVLDMVEREVQGLRDSNPKGTVEQINGFYAGINKTLSRLQALKSEIEGKKV